MSAHDAGPADGPAMEQVCIDGCEILLVRAGGTVQALGAICPHAGAPLAEGVLRDGRVICPWHKAAFDIYTGVCTAPPAVDDLPRYAARVDRGRILVELPADARPEPSRPPDPRCFVLVGAGAAGAAAAQALRANGFAGRVVMIGQEDRLPYDRTLLSKYALSGQEGGEKSPLQSTEFWERHAIERRIATVTALDPDRRLLSFADGATLAYDAVLLAPGGVPRAPDLAYGTLPGLFLLRSAADCEAIVAALPRCRRAVVLGAGFIGMEAAAALCERGLDVTVVAPQAAPFERALGPEVGNALAGLHRARGVRFLLGRSAMSLVGETHVEAVRLDDGSTVAADLVIAGLGVTPATGFVPATLREADGGLRVDAGLALREGIYAAGDVAWFPLHGVGPHARVEHWRVALQHGRIAAKAMLGQPARFTATPYFWTIHFGKALDYAGHAERWDEVVIDGDTAAPAFLAYYLAGGIVRAVAGFDRNREIAKAIALFDERQNWTLDSMRAGVTG
jgi:NADPH-dependent 2,4-dienoyl-CoA reductase/sulfur reductase-like enzyme/nitrite reductase/ring-hydroxylating ferredoxin subunit